MHLNAEKGISLKMMEFTGIERWVLQKYLMQILCPTPLCRSRKDDEL